MSATAMFGWLADAPSGLLLILKATAVLAAAWGASSAVSRRNPRWRVLAWRAAAVGLVAIVGLTFAPPLFRWRVAPPARTAIERVMVAAVADSRPSGPPIDPAEVEPVGPIRPDPARVPPSAEPPAPARSPVAVGTWLLVGWAGGCAASALRFALGAWRLSRVVRRASEAPEAVQEAARATAARLGVRRSVRVVETPAVASPCLTGMIRPVVLLPAGKGLDVPGPDLDAVLIHELTHVRNGDLSWNDALHLASIALWFHPLAWRIRAAHASACDAVCDAVAADQLGDVATYARALARLALQAAARPPARGLAMARAGDVRRRIAALQRMVHCSPLPRSLVMPALFFGAALAALIGGTAVLRAQDDPPTAKPDAPASKTLTVRALDAETGEPLEGVEVEARFSPVGGDLETIKGFTGTDGLATVEYRDDVPLAVYSLRLWKRGRVPVDVRLNDEQRPIPIPGRKDYRMASGAGLGGIVTDEQGRPVEGAAVSLTMPPTESDDGAGFRSSLAEVKTDARGRWRIEEAPADLKRVGVTVRHAGYRTASGDLKGAPDDVSAILEKGRIVKGSVRGPDGAPIVGAVVRVGDSFRSNGPKATTNDEGVFAVENCGEGPATILVRAKGFAPQDRPIVVATETPASDFVLQPGATIRVRVVDEAGAPIGGAFASVDGWHGRGGLDFWPKTDAEGRIVWGDAPRDPVPFLVGKNGFMTTEAISLTADDEEHVVVLHPVLKITGRVTDAATGEPVPKFSVIQGAETPGRDGVGWRRDRPSEFADGRYIQTVNQAAASHHLRVEAPGYRAAESRAFRSDEHAAEQDFALERQPALEGVVLHPDGRPAWGAEVALVTSNHYAFLEGHSLRVASGAEPVRRVGPEGRFSFPKPERDFLLIATSPAGFADAGAEAFARSSTLKLAPWGRIEGVLNVGEKPEAGGQVLFVPDRRRLTDLHKKLTLTWKAQADAQGRFVLDELPPWPAYVGRSILTDAPGGEKHRLVVALTPVIVEPGKTAQVEVGGRGRAVVGRVVLDGPRQGPIDWPRNTPVRLVAEADPAAASPTFLKQFGGAIDGEGRFRIEDVEPGAYQLLLTVDGPRAGEPNGDPSPLGRAELAIEVPDGPRDQAVDLGAVTVKIDTPDRADAAAVAPQPDRPAAKTLTIHALDAETGGPLEGVEVEFRYHADGAASPVVKKAATGRDGVVRGDYDGNVRMVYFSFTLRKAGFVPASVTWSSSRRPVVVPDVKELKLARGRSLAGVVVDESGTPVEGASVDLSMRATEADFENYFFTFATAKTDAQGRWRVGEAPRELGRAFGRVDHPGYRQATIDKLEPGESRTTLMRGGTVTGRVVGPDGKAVAGARATLGRDHFRSNPPETTTDEDGRFVLKRCEPGAAWITIEAPGLAPALADVLVKEDAETPPVAIALESGSALRVRVVDRDGRPLEGVGFGVESWRGRRSIGFRGRTDGDGRMVWNDAPRDAVQVSFSRSGLMARRLSMTATDEERVVVMHPELVASGSVIDAATQNPIPKFRVIQGILFEGRDETYWQRSKADESTDGRYSKRFDESYGGVRVRIEAPGYKPAESRVFRADEGAVTEDFALAPQAGLDGVVLGPDGKPAAGAEVALGLPNVYVGLEGASFGRAYNTPIATTDVEGRFSFPKPEGAFLVVAAGEAGFAEAAPDKFAKSSTIRLSPWGRIEGRLRIGKQPGAGQRVTFQPDLGKSGTRMSQINVSYSLEVQADAEGRFVMDKVVPSPGYVGRVLITQLPQGMTSHTPVGMTPVDVKPGETARVDLGGNGRPVVGRVVVAGQPDSPIDWARNRPVRITVEPTMLQRLFGGSSMGLWTSYGGNFDADGRFRAEDVPPGNYKLTVAIDAPPQGDRPAVGEQLGQASVSFTVPEGDQDKPVDVGDVPVTLDKLLKVGDEAPAIDVERIDGPKGRFMLADRRGKVVVLDFWATWCGPCREEMPALKKLQERFGGDARFELVGVSCDNAPDLAVAYAKKEGLAWTQAFSGPMGTGAAEAYGVRGIPSTFVIGPDGRIVARGLRGGALAEAVAKALAQAAK